MEEITALDVVVYISLALHSVMIGVAIWQVWRGKNVADKLVGVELVSTLFLAVLVLLTFIYDNTLYIDVALGLAALGFISIIALSKYVADEQMF